MTDAARERLQVRLPLFAVSGVAWLLLATRPHAMHGTTVSARVTASALMFAAMMLPMIGPPLRHVRDRSLARHRLRAIALFAGGYSLLWIAAGVALILAANSIGAIAATFLAVAIWQCSPLKQHCLNRCHSHATLSAFGPSADRDALLFGLRHGLWCIGSCFGLMLLPMLLSRGHLAAMAIVTLWLAGERLETPAAPRWQLRGPGKTLRIIAAQARRSMAFVFSARL